MCCSTMKPFDLSQVRQHNIKDISPTQTCETESWEVDWMTYDPKQDEEDDDDKKEQVEEEGDEEEEDFP